MKYLKYFLFAGIILLSSSYTTGTSRISEGIYPGNLMPQLAVSNDEGNKLDLSALKGVKVLVNFWAAYDAESHMKNVLLWNTLQKEKYPVKMVSVSFDKNKTVFEKTLSMDGIEPRLQFIETKGIDSEIYEKYELKKGFKNYLIDENGVIIATNVTPTDLDNLLKQSN